MAFRTAVAAVVFLAVFATQHALVGAQGGPPQGRGGGGAPAPGRGGGRGAFDAGPFTPAPGAKDLKSVLFNWTWRMGCCGAESEAELIKTLDYHAERHVQVDGQPCTLTKYRVQANYQVPATRADRVHAREWPELLERRNGERRLRLGRRHSGRGAVPGKGKATP
jgi:hypothetical protein